MHELGLNAPVLLSEGMLCDEIVTFDPLQGPRGPASQFSLDLAVICSMVGFPVH
jgi:hypothetical protein